MRRIEVTYRQDPESPGSWLVYVTQDDRLHSFGRTIRGARQAITQVIELWYETPRDQAEFVEVYDLSEVAPAANEAVEARQSLAEAERRAADKTSQAARQLVSHGISLRDAADILGIAHQRVHQLVS